MTMSARAIASLLDGLPAETALLLSPLIEAPAAARARRMAARDDALRAAADLIEGGSDYARACALACDLGSFAAGSTWRAHRDADTLPADATPLYVLLHRALRLNDGKPLRWRQALNILRGTRTPCNFLS